MPRPKSGSNHRRRHGYASGPASDERIRLYGLHTVSSALANPDRTVHELIATPNALGRLEVAIPETVATRDADVRQLDRLVGGDAVHQGIVAVVDPIDPLPISEASRHDLVLVLDQVTDPHNVGAIMRSAVAMGAGAIITTQRHAAAETGVLAKSASGALDLIDMIRVSNLSNAIETLHDQGFASVGLDSEGGDELADVEIAAPVALVLGSEGKGLRQRTLQTVQHLARVDLPGPIKSLNVSNAAALALYLVHRRLRKG